VRVVGINLLLVLTAAAGTSSGRNGWLLIRVRARD